MFDYFKYTPIKTNKLYNIYNTTTIYTIHVLVLTYTLASTLPIVFMWVCLNWLSANLEIRQVLPTELSPHNKSWNRWSYFLSVALAILCYWKRASMKFVVLIFLKTVYLQNALIKLK